MLLTAHCVQAAWAGSHGEAECQPPGGFPGGHRRESRRPRGLAHVWPALPAAAGGAGGSAEGVAAPG